MKKIIVLIAVFAVAFSACKKEKTEPTNVIAGIIQKDTTYKLTELYFGTDSQWHTPINQTNRFIVFASDDSVTYTNSAFLSPRTEKYSPNGIIVSMQYYSLVLGPSSYSTFTISNSDTAIVLSKTDYPYKILLKR